MKNGLAISLMAGMAFVTTSVFATTTTYEYLCHSYYWNGNDNERGSMTLSVNELNAKADILEEEWDGNELGGDINPRYRSRGSVKYLKFGRSLIVEAVLATGGKELRDGSLGGFARIEGEAEGGFYQYKFICKLK